VRNPGTAPADQVTVGLNLPAETGWSTPARASWDAASRVVVGSRALAAGEERFLQFRCKFTQPGVNQIA
jgi:hypothetical protein